MLLQRWQGQCLHPQGCAGLCLEWKAAYCMALNENKDKWEKQRGPEQIDAGGQRTIFHRHLIFFHPGTFASALVVGGAIIPFMDWQRGLFFRVKGESQISWICIYPMASSSSFPFVENSMEIARKWWNVGAWGRAIFLCFWNGAFATTVIYLSFFFFFSASELCHWSRADSAEFEETVATSPWRSLVVLWLSFAYFFGVFWNKHCRQITSFYFFQWVESFLVLKHFFSILWLRGHSRPMNLSVSNILTPVNIIFLVFSLTPFPVRDERQMQHYGQLYQDDEATEKF